MKAGIDYSSESLKLKLLTNLSTFLQEATFSYLVKTNVLIGMNLVLNPTSRNLEKYDFGISWSPAAGAFVGLKHESISKDTLQFGKFLMYFMHNATASQTVGTEFALDWQKKVLTARLGYYHKFNDETSGKFKINQNGVVDALLKHKINDNITGIVTTQIDMKSVIAEQKTKTLPLGITLDIKF